jgi:hypothetical protein
VHALAWFKTCYRAQDCHFQRVKYWLIICQTLNVLIFKIIVHLLFFIVGCTPDFINLTISDDLPTNDRSNKVQFFCNNWNSIRVYFRLKNTYDEHRFFSIEHASTGHLNFLILTIKNALYINTWNVSRCIYHFSIFLYNHSLCSSITVFLLYGWHVCDTIL